MLRMKLLPILLLTFLLSLGVACSGPEPAPTPTPESTFVATTLNDDFRIEFKYRNFPSNVEQRFEFFVDQQFNGLIEKAGISVAVYQNGFLWQYAKGEAGSSINFTPETPTLIRSSSKPFIASLILKQIDKGLYSLSDTLEGILSGNDDYDSFSKNIINPNVTVRQLLTMTSGIDDVRDFRSREYTEIQTNPNWEPAHTVRLVTNEFTSPGSYAYSNTNSILLGMIAEHISGQRLNRLYESDVFAPLSLKAILLPQDDAPPNIAKPHGDRSNYGGAGFGDLAKASSWTSDWYESTGRTTWAAAGVVTTPAYLAKWAYELFSVHGGALSSNARRALLDSFDGPMIQIGGQPQQYGYHATQRTMKLSTNDLTVYGHPGGGGGYTSVFYYSPELDASISLVANSHSNERTHDSASGSLTHRTLDEIGQHLFDFIASNSSSLEPDAKHSPSPSPKPPQPQNSGMDTPLNNLRLPFSIESEPIGMMPMGETIKHSPPEGHPGIDFQWGYKEAQIIVGLDGIVGDLSTEISEYNGDTIHHLTIITGAYGVTYEVVEFLKFNPHLKIGDTVSQGMVLGYPQKVEKGDGRMIHWSLGKANPTGGRATPEGLVQNYFLIYMCPLPYLADDELLRIEQIWDKAYYMHKDKYPALCNGFYKLQD
jgi:CubicO group peptidase (beta-lactamase class C family)